MSDKVTSEKRSWIMSRVSRSNTSLERILFSFLRKNKYRFHKNVKSLQGLQILSYQNIKRQFLSTVVFGMDTKNVSLLKGRVVIRFIGTRKSMKTLKEISGKRKN